MTQILHIDNGESMSAARAKINSAIDAANSATQGITIPEIVLVPRQISATGTAPPAPGNFYIDNELYIRCKFPENAEFLQHNPRIYLYRRVFHRNYDRSFKPIFADKPLKKVRRNEKLFAHPVGKSEFAFGSEDAVRYGNNYEFKLMSPPATPFTAKKYIQDFGDIYVNDDGHECYKISRCSRQPIVIKKASPLYPASSYGWIKIGFRLVTDIGESAMAVCKIKVNTWIVFLGGDPDTKEYYLSTSFEVC
ncbi:MAG: hypothetical protein LBP63_08995 [Prevotellaceae bacterium]|jgi:hypothetical protein|nr:hypothetical protein [Prevotellaceae bacterium]